ncbi:hypothetical protein SLEP1_g27863 [Rubroshorea leprosula]|uniref:DUF4283 domain-containing protein n=1 Tax=Rubroshorea leprosula TaxID=152421 RepID=A0AAV5JRR7_9ROSI|nr:hypothetical protein SLEP1_g27863 [Rubroshorea leprosula]
MEERPNNERRKEGTVQRYGSNDANTYGVHSVNLIPNLQEKFFMEGVFFCNIRPMGDVKPWTPTVVAMKRFAWIRCQGLLTHAWKLETFQTFGRLWGNLITLDDITISKKRFNVARFLITTPTTKSTSKSITVKINGEFFILKFTEEESTNNLFTMRSDRIFHAPREEDDEESSSLDSDGVKAFMEDDVATPNTRDGNKNEVASQNVKVARHSDEVEGNKRNEDEIASTSTKIAEETEGMGEIRMGLLDSNSNIQRLGETRKIVADPDIVTNKADQGNFENDSQLSTNADMGSYGKSYQKRKNKVVEDNRRCGEVERYVKDLNDGLPTKEMGLEKDTRPRDPQPVDLQEPTNTGPEEQNEKNSNRSKTKNRKSDFSFWDDLETDSSIDANWMNRNDGCGKRKKKRKAKSCASMYRKSRGLEGFLV